MHPRPLLLCTVGTSLFRPNLEGLKKDPTAGNIRPDLHPLAEAYQAKDWPAVAREFARLPPSEPLCGAEINSIASMIDKGYVPTDCGLFFLHSDTDDGRSIAAVLEAYYRAAGHQPVQPVEVPDLQDQDAKHPVPRDSATSPASSAPCCAALAPACAINATGGYKAKIAIAVLLGQALGVPVYYKHERFREIIAFPPMPVALDFQVWLRFSGWLNALEKDFVPHPAIEEDGWDEHYESLVDAELDEAGRVVLSLSATGQIFHETFRDRFHTDRDRVLPTPAGPGINSRRSCTITPSSTCCRNKSAHISGLSPIRCPRWFAASPTTATPICRRRPGSANGVARSKVFTPTGRERSSSR